MGSQMGFYHREHSSRSPFRKSRIGLAAVQPNDLGCANQRLAPRLDKTPPSPRDSDKATPRRFSCPLLFSRFLLLCFFRLGDGFAEFFDGAHLRCVERVLSHVAPEGSCIQRILNFTAVNFEAIFSATNLLGGPRPRWFARERTGDIRRAALLDAHTRCSATRLNGDRTIVRWRISDRRTASVSLPNRYYQVRELGIRDQPVSTPL